MTARYLDVAATAERLSMSPDAVRRLVKLRRIPFIKVGRSLRFDIQDIDMWMRRQTNRGVVTAPRRIQRSRAPGWRMPSGAIYVGRPTKWGNPYKVNEIVRRADPLFTFIKDKVPGGVPAEWHAITPLNTGVVVAAYFDWLVNQPDLWLSIVPELAGRDLVCWCPLDRPCHADVLIGLANAQPEEGS